jgi:hypothetical protein
MFLYVLERSDSRLFLEFRMRILRVLAELSSEFGYQLFRKKLCFFIFKVLDRYHSLRGRVSLARY